MSENITNTILETNQQMIDASISNLRFDKTEVSTILEVISDIEYQVYNGKTKYKAVSLGDNKYFQNEQVYVQIKEGDYSLDKTIIGKYDITNSEELGQLYQDPFDRLLISQTITIKEELETTPLGSSGKTIDNIEIYTTGLGVPNFIGAKISVSTNIDYRIYPKVEYGLKVELFDKNLVSFGEFPISSKNFVGNIFNFTSELFQKNLLRLPDNFDLTRVKKIRVIPYVNSDKIIALAAEIEELNKQLEQETEEQEKEKIIEQIEFLEEEKTRIEQSLNILSTLVIWDSIILYFGYDNQSSEFTGSSDKVFIDTNTGLKVYNARSSKHETNVKDLQQEYSSIESDNDANIIPTSFANCEKVILTELYADSQYTGNYNDSIYLDNNNNPEKRWHFYNYDGSSTKWKFDWQGSSLYNLSDEMALDMGIVPPDKNKIFRFFANTSFLAYPLQLNISDQSKYRNCFGFFERGPLKYYSKNQYDENLNIATFNYDSDNYTHKITTDLNYKNETGKIYGGFYHFKINLETENERQDLRDKVINVIDTNYVDFKITLSLEQQEGAGVDPFLTQSVVNGITNNFNKILPTLRIDYPRDMVGGNNKTITELFKSSGLGGAITVDTTNIELTLRYYSKNATLNKTNWPTTNPSNYLDDDGVCHIPYGALVWIGNIYMAQGWSLNVSSDFPLENDENVPLTARLKFNYCIQPEAVYAYDYFADKVGIYRASNSDLSSTEKKYFSGATQKIGITELYENPGDWGQYSQDFVIDYGYTYYIGLYPRFSFKGLDTVSNPYIYIDNFNLYTLGTKELTTLYGSWVYNNNVYGKNNIPEIYKDNSVEEKYTITPSWYQKVPNYEGELDGIGPWWKKMVRTPATANTPTIYETDWNLDIKPYLSDKANETFKFVVKKDDETFISEAFILTNEGYSVARDTVESEGLVFTNSDDGVYLYDYTGNLYNNEGTEKTLTVTPKAGEAELQEDNIIAWMIPKNSTMIQPPWYMEKDVTNSNNTTTKEYYWYHKPETSYSNPPSLDEFNDGLNTNRYNENLLNSYYIIEYPCKLDNLTLPYKIKQVYQPNNMNNDILVYVFENATVNYPKYNRSRYIPRFISANNAGAEGSLGIDLVSEKGYLGADNTESIKLKATVYDSAGVPLVQQPVITWQTDKVPLEFYNGIGDHRYGKIEDGNIVVLNGSTNSQYQLIFKANNLRKENSDGIIETSNGPMAYDFKISRQQEDIIDTEKHTITTGAEVYIKQDRSRGSLVDNKELLQTDVIMMSETLLEPRYNGDKWHYPSINTANAAKGKIYYLSKNNDLTIHYIYSYNTQANTTIIPNSYDTTAVDATGLPSDTDLVIYDPITAFVSSNVFAGYKVETTDGVVIETFTPFTFTPGTNNNTDNDFRVVLLNSDKTDKEERNYAFVFDDKITDVYIRVPRGEGTVYGAMPYINFQKTGTTNVKFKLTNYLSLEKHSDSLIISNKANTSLLVSATCDWVRANDSTVKLSQYYVIPYFPTNQKYELEGNTKISYSTFGTNPTSTGKNYGIYKVSSRGKEKIDNFYIEPSFPGNQINALDKKITSNNVTTWTHKLNVPSIAPAETTNGNLDIYIENEWDARNGTPKKNHSQFVAQYPIVLYRDSYAFQEINNWNGTSTITDKAYIISPMIAAGKKNSDNQFTGVMLGTHKQLIDSSDRTGLYGFQNGIATFGFKEDGGCFIGANETTGRIEFNTGDSSSLKIVSKNFKLSSSNVSIDTNGIEINGGDFTIKDKNGNSKFYFDNSTAKLMLQGYLTDGSGTNFYFGDLPAAQHGVGLFAFNKNDNWIKFWPSSAGNTCISGKNGIIITSTANNNTIAKFSASGSDIYSNTITLQASGNNSTCLTQIWGGLEVTYYKNGWYSSFKTNRTSSGGTLYDTWSYETLSGEVIQSGEIRSVGSLGLVNNKTFFSQGNGYSEAALYFSKHFRCYPVTSGNVDSYEYTTWDDYYGVFNLTSSGGRLYGTWFANDFKIGTTPYLHFYRGTWEGTSTKLGIIHAPDEGYLKGTWSVDTPKDTWSDINKKNSISFIGDKYEIFFDNLNPKLFKYNEGTSNRFHTGFIAQEVQQALNIANISTQDFAGLVIHFRNTDSELWSLRYEEFVSINTWQIQKLKARITELEDILREKGVLSNEINK